MEEKSRKTFPLVCLVVGLNLNNHQTRTGVKIRIVERRELPSSRSCDSFSFFAFANRRRKLQIFRLDKKTVRFVLICFSLPLSRTNTKFLLPNVRVNDLARAREYANDEI